MRVFSMILKQYGLERTGTNYLKRLVDLNFEIKVFASILGWKHGMFELRSNDQHTAESHLDWIKQRTDKERGVLSVDNRSLSYTPEDLISWCQNMGYLISYKEIHAYIASMKRFRRPKKPWSDLVDNNTIEFWCKRYITKYRRWIFLYNSTDQCIFVHYDSLLEDYRVELERIRILFNLDPRGPYQDEPRIVKASTDHGLMYKKDTFDKSYYIEKKYLNEIDPLAIEVIDTYTHQECVAETILTLESLCRISPIESVGLPLEVKFTPVITQYVHPEIQKVRKRLELAQSSIKNAVRCHSTSTVKKQFIIESVGRLGNRMFQYMFANEVKEKSTEFGFDVTVSGSLEEWNILNERLEYKKENVLYITKLHCFNLEYICSLFNLYDTIVFSGLGFRYDYYRKNRITYSNLFVDNLDQKRYSSLLKDRLVIHIRSDTRRPHPDYMPLPIDYLIYLIRNNSHLTPLFMGQTDSDTLYNRLLKKTFSTCEFIRPHHSILDDFHMIRSAENIIISISSFAWLASWLSVSNQNIHVPILGLYDPHRREDINLLPFGDNRYHFYQFNEDQVQFKKIYGPK